LENKVLTSADKIITITPFYVRKFESLAKRKITLLTNGYDEDDFKLLRIVPTDKFVIRHVGIINERCDPRPFMEVVEKLISEDTTFASLLHIDFVGEVHSRIRDFVHESPLLRARTSFTPSVPHDQLISMYGKSSLLLLVLTGYKDAEGYLPGKLFEYLATGLPVLGIGPAHGDAAALLSATGAGEMIDDSEGERIKDKVMAYFTAWRNGNVFVRNRDVTKYSRKNITRELTDLF
jgi:glycosyltransferase involved in cell wall biosynthesis